MSWPYSLPALLKQPLRVRHVWCAPLVHEHVDCGVLADQRTRGSCVIEVDMGEKQLTHIRDRESLALQFFPEVIE